MTHWTGKVFKKSELIPEYDRVIKEYFHLDQMEEVSLCEKLTKVNANFTYHITQ